MTETLTGRMRVRLSIDYGLKTLVLQVEVAATDVGAAYWRDAQIEDLEITLRGLPFAHATSI